MSLSRRCAASALALAFALGLATSRPANAALDVSYSTSGTFDINSVTGGPTITLSNGNLTIDISYFGTTETNLSIPDATAPFGYFKVTADTDKSANLPASGTFNLLLTQTNPSNANGTFTSSVSGSIKLGTSNELTITFNSPPNPMTLGTVKYTLPSSVVLTSPAQTTGAFTTTNLTASIGAVDVVATPEPSAMLSAGTGIVMALGWASRNRRRARAA